MRDEEGVRRFVERMARLLAEWGFPRMPARVLMAVTVADEESLTAADLAERLSVSPAAISGALRYLIQVRMITREPVPGSRRDRYRLPDDIWYEVGLGEVPLFKTLGELAAEGTEALGGADTPAGKRVARMREFYHFMENEMPTLLDRWKATHPD
jgi:DNA-binding transcriptional ArsR family regulator